LRDSGTLACYNKQSSSLDIDYLQTSRDSSERVISLESQAKHCGKYSAVRSAQRNLSALAAGKGPSRPRKAENQFAGKKLEIKVH